MLKVGLTGNIGSGKSLAAKIFSVLGIPVFNADDVSKSLLSREDIRLRLSHLFGEIIFTKTGDVDRSALATLVFSDRDALIRLNHIMHPPVMEEFSAWCEQQSGKAYVINESAIIYEYEFQDNFDKIIHVSCPVEIALQRVVRRDGVAVEEVLKRTNSQLTDKEKAVLSDFTILNDGSQLVIPQVLRIHDLLLQVCP